MSRSSTRRRYQFTLRTALVAIALCGLVMAVFARGQRQRDAVAALVRSNPAVRVAYDYQLNRNADSARSILEAMLATLRDILGPDTISKVVAVEMLYPTDADLVCAARLTSLERLDLDRAIDVTDAGLAALASLEHLQILSLTDADRITNVGLAHLQTLTGLRQLALGVRADRVSPGAIEELRRALPRCQIELPAAPARGEIALAN